MKAKLIREWGGAGFSSSGSSIFPTNRGGQMNRGGFGGASNLGGPNMMYTYEIKPLNRLLQPKQSDLEEMEIIHNGNIIEGEELNKKDGKIYIGTIIKTVKSSTGTLNYYLIIDERNSMKIKIDPTTATLLSGKNFVDVRNKEPGRDEAELLRAGQEKQKIQETMRAKFVNENIKDFFTGNKNTETPYRIYDDIIEYKGSFGWKKFPFPEVDHDAEWVGRYLYYNDLFDTTNTSLRWKGQTPLGTILKHEFNINTTGEELKNELQKAFREKFPTPKDYMEWFDKNLKAGKESSLKTKDAWKSFREKRDEEDEEQREIKLAKQKKETF